MDVKLPQLAEGVESGTVVSILVAEGQEVKKDQPIMELETQKAVGSIPAPSRRRRDQDSCQTRYGGVGRSHAAQHRYWFRRHGSSCRNSDSAPRHTKCSTARGVA